MNNKRLNEIKHRESLATPEPWELDQHGYKIYAPIYELDVATMGSMASDQDTVASVSELPANAQFIVNSRADVPVLIDCLEIALARLEFMAIEYSWCADETYKAIDKIKERLSK